MQLRTAPATHRLWEPDDYQVRAVGFLMTTPNAALFLDPGLGKTSCVLAAFTELRNRGIARKMLVVAPKRVCYLVWRQEGAKWTQFKDLRFNLLHGRKKDEALKEDADVYLINPEGLPWLAAKLGPDFAMYFDTIVIDELTKFKNRTSDRFKILWPRVKRCARRWGLTGTPAPNGLLDLFGQILLLDDGNALGTRYTQFRDRYFYPGFDGFEYKPQRGAEERIRDKLRYTALRMQAEDYIKLPDLVDDIIEIEMDAATKKKYKTLKNDMILAVEGAVITSENAASVHGKLKQLAGGAIYTKPEGQYEGSQRPYHVVHDLKLEALADLIEGLNGQQLIVAYEFNHELDRLLKKFGKDTPYLGKGQTDKRAEEIEAAWNRGEIQLLFVHPASSGHGLNMQASGAHHLCWFNPTFDLELYDQLIRRLRRRGNEATRIFNHILCVKGTVDYLALDALKEKDGTQERLLQGLKAALRDDFDPVYQPAAGRSVAKREEDDPMAVKRLVRSGSGEAPAGWGQPAGTAAPAQTAPAQQPPQEAPRQAPAGWGQPAPQQAAAPAQETQPVQAAAPTQAPAGWGQPAPQQAAPAPAPEINREAIAARLTGADGSQNAGVQNAVEPAYATGCGDHIHVSVEVDYEGAKAHFSATVKSPAAAKAFIEQILAD